MHSRRKLMSVCSDHILVTFMFKSTFSSEGLRDVQIRKSEPQGGRSTVRVLPAWQVAAQIKIAW